MSRSDESGNIPSKSILKKPPPADPSSSPKAYRAKATQWDEMNIVATLHPTGKSYGHMKIDEPKTPYYSEEQELRVVDPVVLRERLKNITPRAAPEDFVDDDDEDEDEDAENCYFQGRRTMRDTAKDVPREQNAQSSKQSSFQDMRKKHYNEFQIMLQARELGMQEFSDDDEDEDEGSTKAIVQPVGAPVALIDRGTQTDFVEKKKSLPAPKNKK